MKVALTGAAGFLGQALLPRLAAAHQLVATDLKAVPGPVPIHAADVTDPETMRALCQGVDAVIHLARAVWEDDLDDGANQTRILQTRLKGTYNLLQAAGQAQVTRVIQISDLCILDGYADDIMVSEDFLPLPDTSAHQQSVYLSEWIARDFAHQKEVEVLTLRLGALVETAKLATDAQYADGWLDLEDAVEAIVSGLERQNLGSHGAWALYNLAADVPQNRYSLLKIQSKAFGFFPRQDFAPWRGGH